VITSEVEVVNSALIKLGAERIVTLDDASNRARLLKEQYSKIRDNELRGHPWKFAIKRTELAVIDPKPDGFDDWAYVFQLPADNLRIVSIVNGTTYDRWDTEAGIYLLADTDTITIRHIFRQTDVTKWDDNFVEVVAWALAKDIAYSLTQSSAAVKSAMDSYKDALQLARSFNAQQGSVQRVQAEEWTDSRFY
jgi:hypothetical protein